EQRRSLQQRETDDRWKVQRGIGLKVADLSQKIGNLAQAEKDELARTLRAQQEQHINTYLRRFPIENATIPGIGPVFKSRLKAAGFQTAADIFNNRWLKIQGIGASRMHLLVQWRKSIESKAQAAMPQTLPQHEIAAIRTKYEGQRRSLESERDREQK